MQTAGFIGKIPDSIDFYLFDLALRKKSGSIFGSRERGEANVCLASRLLDYRRRRSDAARAQSRV